MLLAFGLFFVVPLAWLVLAPTKTDSDLLTSSPLAIGNLHNVWVAWQNLDAFGGHIYRRWLENSLLYSLSATAIALVVGVPAGYGLAVGRFRGRSLVLSLTLVAMLIPASSLVLPIYLELNAMQLIGSVFSIILPFAFFPFGVYLAYMYYATALPPGLLDAARVDGCSELQTFLQVALPLAKPVVALVFFFSFVATGTTSSALRDPAGSDAVSRPGRPDGHLQRIAPHPRARHADRGTTGCDCLRRLPACSGTRSGRRRDQRVNRPDAAVSRRCR